MIDDVRARLDSGANPYIYNRMNDLRWFIGDWRSKEGFRYMLGQLRYYKKKKDRSQEAFIALMLSNSLQYAYAPRLTLKYLGYADSLYQLLGMEDRRMNVRFNEATVLGLGGMHREAVAKMDTFFHDSAFVNDIGSYEILLRNHYRFSEDNSSLFKGYRLVSSLADPDSTAYGLATLRGLYETLLCEHYLAYGPIDSAAYYGELAQRHLPELTYDEFRSKAYEVIAKLSRAQGKKDRELEALREYVVLRDTIHEQMDPEAKIYLDNVNSLHEYEMKASADGYRMKMRFYVFVGVALLLILGLVILIQRRVQRLRLKEKDMEIEAERRERQIMAMALSREESDKVLAYVKDEVASLRRSGNISGSDVMKIENNMKLHLAGHSDVDTFAKTFADINPNFAGKLREIAPDLSDNNVRLCSYIMMGMSNNEIANVMHVKASSLRQSRLRLRQKFGLTKDDSIEDFLRKLTD